MKLSYLAFYVFAIASLSYFEVLDFRPLHAFVNSPFDEEMKFHPHFSAWKKEIEGKLNVIFLKYGRITRRRALRFIHARFSPRSEERRENQFEEPRKR